MAPDAPSVVGVAFTLRTVGTLADWRNVNMAPDAPSVVGVSFTLRTVGTLADWRNWIGANAADAHRCRRGPHKRCNKRCLAGKDAGGGSRALGSCSGAPGHRWGCRKGTGLAITPRTRHGPHLSAQAQHW
eukprot:3319760-Prymnesium_polylepis.1